MSGQGVRMKRLEKFMSKLTEKGAKGPWNVIHDKAKRAAQKLIQQHIEEFTKQILEIFEKFHGTFLRLFKTDQNDAPGIKALREKLMQKLPYWTARISTIQSLIRESEG